MKNADLFRKTKNCLLRLKKDSACLSATLLTGSLLLLWPADNFSQQSVMQINLGPAVNSEYNELRPLISPDGKTLYFIREGHPQNTRINRVKDCQDIWVCYLQADNSWSQAQHLEYPFNMDFFNGIFGITPDGNTLLLRGAWKNDKYLGPGFSVSHKKAKGWSSPEMIEVKDFREMNKGRYYGSCLSNDGNVMILYFSEIPDSKNSDLYISFRNQDNSWSRPVKIKEPVNSEYDESSPFLASDEKTLYFASDRPGGFGKHDIYMTRRTGKGWDEWSAPQNLGPGINSEGWEAHYSLDAKGQYAYMVSQKNSTGKADIVKIELKEEEKPNPVVLLYGKVMNMKNNQPLQATITFEPLSGEGEAGKAETDPQTGIYKIVLPYGIEYGISASAKGFISISDFIDLSDVSAYKEIKNDLLLAPIEVGTTIRLNNIFFDFGKSELRPESYPELERLVQLMKENPKMTILLSGHTDNVGNPHSNLKLSEERVNAVRDYLISKNMQPWFPTVP